MMILQDVLKRIKPTAAEENALARLASAAMARIKIPDAKPMLGGSSAKGTWLKGGHDIDIYVQFDFCRHKGKDISSILHDALKKAFRKADALHGSRDYFQVKYKGSTLEIVPILGIREADEAENITDISPLHVEWVKKHKEKADEIRLAKAFCKAGDVYGAESYIQGFSGYVLEIMTVYYGSFNAMIADIAKWDAGAKKVIDVEGYYKGRDVMKELNVAKVHSPLILIDPVQDSRNAGAGVGIESFRRLIELAKAYLAAPSADFFFRKKMTLAMLRKKAGKNQLIIVEAGPLAGKKDVVGAKLLKCLEFLKRSLSERDFTVLDSGWQWEKKALFWIIVPRKKLSRLEMHMGPPLNVLNRVLHFRRIWKKRKMIEKDGRIYAMIPRDYCDARDLVKDLLKYDYIKSRVKRAVLKK